MHAHLALFDSFAGLENFNQRDGFLIDAEAMTFNDGLKNLRQSDE